MRGFDYDDHIQQALALTVTGVATVLLFFSGPGKSALKLGLWFVIVFAVLWFLLIAKAICEPLAWLAGFKAIFQWIFKKKN